MIPGCSGKEPTDASRRFISARYASTTGFIGTFIDVSYKDKSNGSDITLSRSPNILRLACQLLICQPLAEFLRYTQVESSTITNVFLVVMTESLFVDIAGEMERANCNIGFIQTVFQESSDSSPDRLCRCVL